MEAPGGNRAGFVSAVATRTAVVADAKRDLLRHAVVATMIGNRSQMLLAQLSWAFARRFNVSKEASRVSWITKGELLIWFGDLQVCATALAVQGLLPIGQVSFAIAPWTRFRNATAEVLQYKARVH
jgi:hypothetical protein